MCYAGGPYCDKKYASMISSYSKALKKDEEKRKIASEVLKEMESGGQESFPVPSHLRKYKESLQNKEKYIVENAHEELSKSVNLHKTNVYLAKNELLTKSPSGIEALQAGQLSQDIRNYENSKEASIAKNYTRKRAESYHMKHLRDTAKKYLPEEQAKDPRIISRFNSFANAKKFEYSNYHINKGEPFYTEEAKEPFTKEDIKKIGEKVSSQRVIYHTGYAYATGYMVSDGLGKVSIIPDVQNADTKMRTITPERMSKVRPTDAPGAAYSPYTNRANTWDNASKSKTRNKVAPVWESYKKEDDTPEERELRAKVFHSAYTTSLAQKKYLDAEADSYQRLAESSRDVSVGAMSAKEYKAYEKKESRKIQSLIADYQASRLISDKIKDSWERTPKGQSEKGTNIESNIFKSL